MLHHVVPGKVMAADVLMLKSAKTAGGEELTIDAMGDQVMINDAKVTKTDIECSNGIIHVIDTVLMP